MKSTKGVQTESKPPKFIGYGVQKLKVNSIETLIAKKESSPGSGEYRKVYQFNMETPEDKTPGFEGWEGAKGKIGKVQFPNAYLLETNEDDMDLLVKLVGQIGDKLGTREEIDALDVEGLNMEKYMEKVAPFIIGRFAFWRITVEKYKSSTTGKIGDNLKIGRYGFIASLEEGIDHLKPLDMTDVFDFKPLDKSSTDSPDNTSLDRRKKQEKSPF
jgi:hypothetical protein